jgi:two-component system, OmpR family, response regulator
MTNLLLIDDDSELAAPLARYLSRFDMNLDSVTKPSAGLSRLKQKTFDAIILDVMLPEMDGFEVCRTIRKHSNIPILMLTARGEVTDKVVGLELGADDYLSKPFEPRELVARIQSILRRHLATSMLPSQIIFNGLAINTHTLQVTRLGEELQLTGMEYSLLLFLANEAGRVFSRDDLLNHLRGHETELFTRSIDIAISRLRKKLEPLDCIKTLRNIGYCLALEPLAP